MYFDLYMCMLGLVCMCVCLCVCVCVKEIHTIHKKSIQSIHTRFHDAKALPSELEMYSKDIHRPSLVAQLKMLPALIQTYNERNPYKNQQSY